MTKPILVSVQSQRGIALIVSLILLVIITLMALSGMQGTNLQERMSGNMYDRSLAMQAAEAALRGAEAAIASNAGTGLDCAPDSGNQCAVVPTDSFNGTSGSWVSLGSPFSVNDAMAVGNAQYHIQIVGDGSIENPLGHGNSANCAQYGAPCTTSPDARHYRVTARSHDPTSADSAHRSIVVLQTTVIRALD